MKKIIQKRHSLKKKPEFSQQLLENDYLPPHSKSSVASEKLKNDNSPHTQQNLLPPHSKQSLGRLEKQSISIENVKNPVIIEIASNLKEEESSSKQPVIEGYGWDFCLVLPNPEFYKNREEARDLEIGEGVEVGKRQNRRGSRFEFPTSFKKVKEINANKVSFEDIMERLYCAGLQTYCFQSGDNDEIYIKIRASLRRLQEHATAIGFEMLYDPNYLQKYMDNKDSPIADDPDITSITPYQFIYGPYDLGKCYIFVHFLLY